MRFVCLLQKFDHSVFIAGNSFLLWAPQFFSHHHRSVVGHLARRPRSVCGLWQRQSLHLCLSQNHCLWYVGVNVSHWFSTHVCELSAEEGMCVVFNFVPLFRPSGGVGWERCTPVLPEAFAAVQWWADLSDVKRQDQRTGSEHALLSQAADWLCRRSRGAQKAARWGSPAQKVKLIRQ